MMKKHTPLILAFNLLLCLVLVANPVLAAPPADIYIPVVLNSIASVTTGPTVNVPFINDSTYQVTNSHMGEMAIYWFGQVAPETNYTDVRIAHNNVNLILWIANFDRSLWYNTHSNGSDLENWDSVAVAIQTETAGYTLPAQSSHRFVVALRNWEDMSLYTRQYQGNGSAWAAKTTAFTANSFYRGEIGFNTVPPPGNALNRGWGATIAIPFTALGFSGPPPQGTLWRIHTRVYDRDNPTAPGAPQSWPPSSDLNNPSTWGNLRFGLPPYATPPSKNLVSVEVKNGVNNISAPDAQVGGAFWCGTSQNFFDVWGNLNWKQLAQGYAPYEEALKHINIQNQNDIADFACFSKYYVTFPLSSLPAGKLIRSAKLVMTHYGGSDPSGASASWIQAFSVSQPWDEAAITWNNGPLAVENLAWTYVPVVNPNWSDPQIWSKLPRPEWNVSRAVDQAYRQGQPIRLALYSADKAIHSGKYFVAGDEVVNTNYIPKLVIEYVDP